MSEPILDVFISLAFQSKFINRIYNQYYCCLISCFESLWNLHQLFNVNKNWNHKLKVTLRHSIFDYVVINEQFFITVPKLRYKITLRHSIFDQVLISKQFFITVQKRFKKNYSMLFLSATLSSIRIVIGTNVTVLRWYTFFFFFAKWGKGSLNFIWLLRVVFSSQHRRYWGSNNDSK